jgi:hypothetical protein
MECFKCNFKDNNNSKYCSNCGEKLTQQQSKILTQINIKKHNSNPNNKIKYIVLTIIIFICFLIVGVSYMNNILSPSTRIMFYSKLIGLNLFQGLFILSISSLICFFSYQINLNNRILFRKVCAYFLDWSVILFITLLYQLVFSFNIKIDLQNNFHEDLESIRSMKEMEFIFKNRIVGMIIGFIAIYFTGQLNNRTFGMKILKLEYYNNKEKNSFKLIAIIKTIIYLLPLILIYCGCVDSFDSQLFYYSNGSILSGFGYLIITIEIFLILIVLINKSNRSIAELITNTKTIISRKILSNEVLSKPFLLHAPQLQETILSDLKNLINKEKNRLFSSKNEEIIKVLKYLIIEKNNYLIINEAYQKKYNISLRDDLLKISMSYETTDYFFDHFKSLAICEDQYPYRIL